MVTNTFTAVALNASITGIETHRHLGEKRYKIKDHLDTCWSMEWTSKCNNVH